MNTQTMTLDGLINNLTGTISGVFACMEVAEEEIQKARLSKAQSSRAFRALCPGDALRGKSLEIYRLHAREIIERIRASEKLEPATDAELLAIFSDTSLVAPMNRTGQACFEHLFYKLFPGKVAGEAARGPWPHAVNEQLTAARKKFSAPRGGA